jgi:hypothetical protein
MKLVSFQISIGWRDSVQLGEVRLRGLPKPFFGKQAKIRVPQKAEQYTVAYFVGRTQASLRVQLPRHRKGRVLLNERVLLSVVLLVTLLSCSGMAGRPSLDAELLGELSLECLLLSAELLSRVSSLDELLAGGIPLDPSDDGVMDSIQCTKSLIEYGDISLGYIRAQNLGRYVQGEALSPEVRRAVWELAMALAAAGVEPDEAQRIVPAISPSADLMSLTEEAFRRYEIEQLQQRWVLGGVSPATVTDSADVTQSRLFRFVGRRSIELLFRVALLDDLVHMRANSDLDHRWHGGTGVPTPLELVFPDVELREEILQAFRLLALAGVEEPGNPTAWSAVDLGTAMLSGEFMEEITLEALENLRTWKWWGIAAGSSFTLPMPPSESEAAQAAAAVAIPVALCEALRARRVRI